MAQQNQGSQGEEVLVLELDEEGSYSMDDFEVVAESPVEILSWTEDAPAVRHGSTVQSWP